jgi:hypothetical protein
MHADTRIKFLRVSDHEWQLAKVAKPNTAKLQKPKSACALPLLLRRVKLAPAFGFVSCCAAACAANRACVRLLALVLHAEAHALRVIVAHTGLLPPPPPPEPEENEADLGFNLFD